MNRYGDLPFQDIFQHMALYTTTEDTPAQQKMTLLRSQFIYNTTGVQVPAVLVNMTKFVGLQPTADGSLAFTSNTTLFSCL